MDLESTFISFILFKINDVIIDALSHLSIIAKPILELMNNSSRKNGSKTVNTYCFSTLPLLTTLPEAFLKVNKYKPAGSADILNRTRL